MNIDKHVIRRIENFERRFERVVGHFRAAYEVLKTAQKHPDARAISLELGPLAPDSTFDVRVADVQMVVSLQGQMPAADAFYGRLTISEKSRTALIDHSCICSIQVKPDGDTDWILADDDGDPAPLEYWLFEMTLVAAETVLKRRAGQAAP